MPVWLLRIRFMASMRCSSLRNRAFSGVSGRKMIRTTAQTRVMTPKMIKSHCTVQVSRECQLLEETPPYSPGIKSSSDVCYPKCKQSSKHGSNSVAKEPDAVSKWLLLALIPHSGNQREAWRYGCLCCTEKKSRDQKAFEVLHCGMTYQDDSPYKAWTGVSIFQPVLVICVVSPCAGQVFAQWKADHQE